MSINTIIFDFDGTIANTNDIVISSWQHTYKTVWGHEEDVNKIVATFGEPLHITMARVFPDRDTDEVIGIYRGYQVNHYKEKIYPFPGMKELMIGLKEKGLNVAVVTSRTGEATMIGLEKFGLLDYVDRVISCDDTDKHKPDPEPVLLALEHFDVSPEQALMIGDSMFDIKCAHNAGVKAVLVDWAIAVKEEDLNGPDAPEFRIAKAEDLFSII